MNKKIIILTLLTISALIIPNAEAQFKIHNSGRISLQSTSTSCGIQIDTAGMISIEPNLSTSYCRTGQTRTNTNFAKVWIITPVDPSISTGDNFYVLGRGDIYGGSLYSIPGSGGGGNISKESQPIDNATEILSELTGYYFENHEFDGFLPDFEGNPEIDPKAIPGLIRDMELEKVVALDVVELEKTFPEAIRHDPQGKIGINYSALIPVFIEAFKEQQHSIERLEKEIADLKNINKEYDEMEEKENTKNILYQNTPNPTNSITTINCFIDHFFSKAIITIYDLNGLQLMEYPIFHQGNNTITIQANEFRPGIYLYSLLVDGDLIDTKQMVITSK